ncbi:MAG: RES domain-containing protein [Pyrinomonadaceae bacterium]
MTGAAVGGGIGRLIGGEMTVPKGAINKSAATVFINGILAARSCIDTALCQDHTLQQIATGATSVFIEKFPAARVSDTGACSFKISKGSNNVFITEATGQCAGVEITPEVEPWLENLHIATGLIGSFLLGYGALGWAGSALTTGLGFGGSILGSEIGGALFGKWGAIGGGIIGGIIGGGFGVGISRGLGRIGTRGFNPSRNPQGFTYEGKIYRYENPNRVGTTWQAHKWNVEANHRYSGHGKGGVYGGTTQQTALSEITHYNAAAGRIPVAKNVRVANVLDLTNPSVRQQLDVSLEDLTSNSYTTTQRIGDWARQNGYDGILAPSARNPGGGNLVVFDGF